MATAVASRSQITAQPPVVTSATPSPSFLARCREDLSPDKVTSLERWSTAYSWLFAGGTFVFYTTAAVTAFVATSILLPVYAPIAAFTAALLAIPVGGKIKKLVETSDNLTRQANNYRALQNHYQEIAGRSTQQTQADLMSRGIIWYQIPRIDISHPEDLAALNPVLAQAKYLDGIIQKYSRLKEEYATQARDLAATNFAANRTKIKKLRHVALYAGDMENRTKIQAAFVNAVLRKYDFNGKLKDIASVAPATYRDRILGQALNDNTGINPYLTFTNRNIAPLSSEEVKAMGVPLLGQRIAAAMP